MVFEQSQTGFLWGGWRQYLHIDIELLTVSSGSGGSGGGSGPIVCSSWAEGGRL